jgi:hypothetical protein
MLGLQEFTTIPSFLREKFYRDYACIYMIWLCICVNTEHK